MPANLGNLLRGGSDHALSDRTAPGATTDYTFDELNAMADAVAHGLVAAGHKPGTRIGLVGANSARVLAVLFGAMRAGCVVVPINGRAGAETVAFMCADAELALVFADAQGRAAIPAGLAVVPLDTDDYETFVRPGAVDAVEPNERDTAMVLYTSGSTGRPKGVVLSHHSQTTIVAGYITPTMVECLRLGPAIVAAPLFHMNGLVFSMLAFHLRGSVVLMARFDAVAFIEALGHHRVSVLSGVPTMTALMAQETDALARNDMSGVLLVIIGSAPLSDTVLAQVNEIFPQAAVINSYGTTETGAGYFGAHPEGQPRPHMSVGHPQPHAELRLVGDDAPAQGVLQVRSPTQMTEYLNQPELTAERLRDGWIDTGDIMRRDAHGFFYFVGRADDMFVCAGENVYPGAVERILERHPDVLEVAVVPVPDDIRGHIPVAFIVAKAGTRLSEQAVKDHVLTHAAPYMHPRHVWFLEQMPLGGTNKIDRHALKAEALRLHGPQDNNFDPRGQ